MWHLNTRKHLKIWFSLDENCFLTFENQYRFIQAILANPEAQFTFAYCSSVLSDKAHEALHAFCQRNHIVPFDIKKDLPSLLKSDLERNLYAIAMTEIIKANSNEGGNLGAASDCIRLISAVLEKGGIYSDFDVQLMFQSLPHFVPVQSPLLLPASYEADELGLKSYSLNNEVFALTCKSPEVSVFCKNALERLEDLQLAVIKRYVKPSYAFFGGIHKMPTFIRNDKELSTALKKLFDDKGECSIFEVRTWIREQDLKHSIKKKLYQASVELVSGPYVMLAAFLRVLPNFNLLEAMRSDSPTLIQAFIEELQKLSFKGNGLHDYVIGQDHQAFGQEICDTSWTPEGALKAGERSDRILKAVLTIQRHIRTSKAIKSLDEQLRQVSFSHGLNV